jgi:hypothetical protein
MQATLGTAQFVIPSAATSDSCIDAALENIQRFRELGSKPEYAFLVHIAAICMREADEWKEAERLRDTAK